MIAGRRPAARGPSAFARNIDELRTAFPDIRLSRARSSACGWKRTAQLRSAAARRGEVVMTDEPSDLRGLLVVRTLGHVVGIGDKPGRGPPGPSDSIPTLFPVGPDFLAGRTS
jgi:hypothetical protein